MIETPVRSTSGDFVEESLRARLVRGDTRASTVQPILRHLLGSDNRTIFGDEILARIRGMLAHLAQQLLEPLLPARGPHDPSRHEALMQALLSGDGILTHLHALALEWQLTERLEQRLAIDPVVPPLVQALIASPEPDTHDIEPGNHELGMRVLTAQARWSQAQRQMRLGLAELPGDRFHEALLALRAIASHDPAIAAAEATLRGGYDEGANRLGLAARLVTHMGNGAAAALDLNHAGVALFISALALRSGQGRDAVLLTTHESQAMRLALSLRAAGLAAARVRQQMLALHPDAALPDGFDRLGVERASAILADTQAGRS